MGLALAFKRTARFYTPPLRRGVARAVPFLFAWLLGLCTGLYGRPVDHNRVTAFMLGGLALLTLLRKWATDPARQPPAEQAP